MEPVSETANDFITYCPFHGNTNTPAFSVSKLSGKYICFNMACEESGSLLELVRSQKRGMNDFQAARLIHKGKVAESDVPFEERMRKAMYDEEMPVVEMSTVSRLVETFWQNEKAQEYMHGRGFFDRTLKDFKVGYSVKKQSISVPMFDVKGKPVGFIGRRLDIKSFKNSIGLPTRQTLWNLHRAVRTGSDTVIICESTFDAMLVAQAGYPNVVACLGGNFSVNHEDQLRKYFNRIIIFTDWDNSKEHNYDKPASNQWCAKCKRDGYTACKGHNPGRDKGMKIANAMKGKSVQWASYAPGLIYPAGTKDAGDMTMDQIRLCITNAMSNVEYQQMDLYYQHEYDKALAQLTS
jgi:DNA primase